MSKIDVYPTRTASPSTAQVLTGTTVDGEKVAADVYIRNDAPLEVNVASSTGTSSIEVAPLGSARLTAVNLTTSWVPLPATALPGRKSVAIQSQATGTVAINFTGLGNDGWRLSTYSTKVLTIDDGVTVYGKMAGGVGSIGSVVVEELA